MSDPLRRLAGLSGEAWLVGGAVRDRLLGRPTTDFDVVMSGPVADTARRLGRAAGGFTFELSEAFGAWRVVAHDRSWQVDLMSLEGPTIDADLARRDLTVNAIAQRLGEDGFTDPYDGVADIAARRLRAVSDRSFTDDPLRTARLARFAAELGFAAEPATVQLARSAAGGLAQVAPERVFGELRRIVCADRALEGLALAERAGVLAQVLPELPALRGVEQSRFHHLDVFEHTQAVLAETIALEHDPERLAGDRAGELVAALAQPLANEMTRGQAVRFGALMHDIAKPQTRAVRDDGRITFMGHDALGARMSGEILGRLRASERLREFVAKLTLHHLTLGFLVHEMPLPRRRVYDYLQATSPVAVDVTVLSVADRLATRGDNAEGAIARHVELAREMIGEALDWVAAPPRPPVRGDELAAALGITPGPRLGELLAELRAATFSGEVHTAQEAIDRARQLIAGSGPGS